MIKVDYSKPMFSVDDIVETEWGGKGVVTEQMTTSFGEYIGYVVTYDDGRVEGVSPRGLRLVLFVDDTVEAPQGEAVVTKVITTNFKDGAPETCLGYLVTYEDGSTQEVHPKNLKLIKRVA